LLRYSQKPNDISFIIEDQYKQKIFQYETQEPVNVCIFIFFKETKFCCWNYQNSWQLISCQSPDQRIPQAVIQFTLIYSHAGQGFGLMCSKTT